MSLAHLNQESRNELERRVLAAALKQSLLQGDKTGAKLAHECLTVLLKVEKKDESESVVVAVDLENTDSEIIEPTQAADNNNEDENTIQQLQKIGDRPAKSALNIDFELPPAEKAKMKAASAKSVKAVKPSDAIAKVTPQIELTATAENQTIYGSEGDQMIAGIVLPPFLTEPQIGLQYHALYKMLGVRQTASRDDIHQTFLRLVRRILRELKGAKRPSRQELLGYLRKIWIAHDILTDPNTRTDYDFRDLGLRGAPESEPPPDLTTSRPQSTQMLLRIGELLQAAGLLETAELDIACDMHKAMPEMMFGTFLVRQGFIADSELESVLFGQKALRAGAISVAQFQVAMELAREQTLAVKDALIEKGFATRAQLDELDQKQEKNQASTGSDAGGNGKAKAREVPVAEATNVALSMVASEVSTNAQDTLAPVVEEAAAPPTSSDVRTTERNEASTVEGIEERVASAQPLQISKALPSWKDQLDWSSPEKDTPSDATKATEVEIAPEAEVTESTEPTIATDALVVPEAVIEPEAVVEVEVTADTEVTAEGASPAAPDLPEETSEIIDRLEQLKAQEQAVTDTTEAFEENAKQGDDASTRDVAETDHAPIRRETVAVEQEPGLFSHMREAASFYDAEEDFFATYNFGQSESEGEKSKTDEAEPAEEAVLTELETPEESNQIEPSAESNADKNLKDSQDLGASENLKPGDEDKQEETSATKEPESAIEPELVTEPDLATESVSSPETESTSDTETSINDSTEIPQEIENDAQAEETSHHEVTHPVTDAHNNSETDVETKATETNKDEDSSALEHTD